jgi:hypothetical protein
VIAIAGLLASLGSVMTWARLVVDGVGQQSVAGTSGERDGKITVVLGAALLVLGLVIVARRGRLWAGITGTVLGALAAFTALADIGDISNRSASLQPFGRIEVGSGLILVLVASVVACGCSVVALSVRREINL